MDSLKRLDRIRHNGQHFINIAIFIGAGYFIAVILFIFLLFVLRSLG